MLAVGNVTHVRSAELLGAAYATETGVIAAIMTMTRIAATRRDKNLFMTPHP